MEDARKSPVLSYAQPDTRPSVEDVEFGLVVHGVTQVFEWLGGSLFVAAMLFLGLNGFTRCAMEVEGYRPSLSGTAQGLLAGLSVLIVLTAVAYYHHWWVFRPRRVRLIYRTAAGDQLLDEFLPTRNWELCEAVNRAWAVMRESSRTTGVKPAVLARRRRGEPEPFHGKWRGVTEIILVVPPPSGLPSSHLPPLLWAWRKRGDRNPASVVARVRGAAEKGDTHAQYQLALLHLVGDGVEKDFAQALGWLNKAVSRGNPWAQTMLGMLHLQGEGVVQDASESVHWFRRAAEAGLASAECMLGLMLLHGEGTQQDWPQAFAWFLKAAKQWHTLAQFNLGAMYWNGQGVQQDMAQATMWVLKAVEEGEVEAQYALGMAYATGDGIARNPTEAAAWFRRAAEQGCAPAQAALDAMRRDGEVCKIEAK